MSDEYILWMRYIFWNVLLSQLNGEQMLSERWTHTEWTVCKPRVNESKTQTECKHERKVKASGVFSL